MSDSDSQSDNDMNIKSQSQKILDAGKNFSSQSMDAPINGKRIFLMTSGDRYQQYWMDTSETEVFFYRHSRTEKGVIVHQLKQIHVASIDAEDRKVICTSRRHFVITLSTVTGHRKLYFLSHKLMLEGINYLLHAQGFQKRISQYVFKKYLPHNEINTRWIAVHRRTKECFDVQQVASVPANNPFAELATNSLKVLQSINKCKFTVELVDYFEEDDKIYLISGHSNKSLRNYIVYKKIVRMPEKKVCEFIGQIALCVEKLHQKLIMHRDLSIDSVNIKIKKTKNIAKSAVKERVYVTLSQFSLAHQLKKDYAVQQQFNLDRNVAPEIKNGQPSDLSVDVWALGQIAYQLLCCPGSDDILTCQTIDSATGEAISKEDQLNELQTTAGTKDWNNSNGISQALKNLITLMVMPAPQNRPTMAQVIQFPAFGWS